MENISIVYLLGNGSKWNNNELKYSIRSIDDYIGVLSDIYCIGECPDYFGENVYHIPTNKIAIPELDIINCLILACKCKSISDDFLLMHDDMFFQEPTDIEKYPYYYNTTIEKTLECVTLSPEYRVALTYTLYKLKSKDYLTLNFDIHRPIIYNKHKLLATIESFSLKNAVSYTLKSLYCNQHRVVATQADDLKVKFTPSLEEFKRRIKDKPIFSIGDYPLEIEGVKEYFEELYPNKSCYEK